MTTIVDVARAAGVSTATVSRVLNKHPHVDPRLASVVMQAVKDLGYQPSRVARSLRTRRNRVWALVISDIRTGPFFADVVRGVEDVAYSAGYSLFLCNTDEDPLKEASYINLAVAENVGGVVLTPSGPRTDLGSLASSGTPVVLVDRKLPDQGADTVVVDNVLGATQAVAHLLAGGYQRVACITGPLSTTTGLQRYQGYARTLEQAGVPVHDRWVRVADFREAGGRAAMQELLALAEPPEAVFVANNLMTVVGFDDVPWASLLRPPLTTVAQPAYDLGLESARLLLSRLEGYSGAARLVTLAPTLRVRESSAPKAQATRPAVATGDRDK